VGSLFCARGAILARMAEFRIDQATPGSGTAGRSRHDLIQGEAITLVATSPTGVGVTYTWEMLDKVGSTATLSGTSGPSVTIGGAGAVTRPCAFLVKMTANDGGNISEVVRIASVRTLNKQLRVPLFPETAPTSNRLNSNNPDLSTDNASYPNRAGTGVTGQNWRGWAEWAYEITLAVEAGGGGGPSNGIKFHLRNGDSILVDPDYQYLVKAPLIIDPGAGLVAAPGGQIAVLP
jgi:hypothetical protein